MKSIIMYPLLTCFLICACHDASESANKPTLPGELAGEWYTGNISSIQYIDPNTGVFKPTVGLGEGYNIRPDGSYADNVIVQSRIGSDFIYIEGTIDVSGDRLTFHQTKRIVMHKEPGAKIWTQKAGQTRADKRYVWRIKTEQESGNTKVSLCLKDDDENATGEICYKKR